LGAKLTPSAACGRGLDPVERGDQQADTGFREPGEQVAGGVVPADGLGHHAVDRAGVKLGDEPERGGPGDVVAVRDGVGHRCRPAPCGQQREMQVHPSMRGNLQRRPWDQRPVRGDRAAVWRERPETAEEVLFAGRGRLEHLQAGLRRALPDRAGADPAAPAGRGIGPGDDRRHLVSRLEQRVE
jgi:hypothetical protein